MEKRTLARRRSRKAPDHYSVESWGRGSEWDIQYSQALTGVAQHFPNRHSLESRGTNERAIVSRSTVLEEASDPQLAGIFAGHEALPGGRCHGGYGGFKRP